MKTGDILLIKFLKKKKYPANPSWTEPFNSEAEEACLNNVAGWHDILFSLILVKKLSLKSKS